MYPLTKNVFLHTTFSHPEHGSASPHDVIKLPAKMADDVIADNYGRLATTAEVREFSERKRRQAEFAAEYRRIHNLPEQGPRKCAGL